MPKSNLIGSLLRLWHNGAELVTVNGASYCAAAVETASFNLNLGCLQMNEHSESSAPQAHILFF